MDLLEKAVRKNTGAARTIGEVLLEICRMSPRAAGLVEQDLANPEMSLAKCAGAMKEYARKHQTGGCWSCACFRIDPENEAVKVILDFYKIPAEWLGGKGQPAPDRTPAGRKVDLMELL